MEGTSYPDLLRVVSSALLSGGMLTVICFFWRVLFSFLTVVPSAGRAALRKGAFSFCKNNIPSPYQPKNAGKFSSFCFDFLTVGSGGILFMLFSYAKLCGVFRFYALFFYLFGVFSSDWLLRVPRDFFFDMIYPILMFPAAFASYSVFFALHRFSRFAAAFFFLPVMRRTAAAFGRIRHEKIRRRKMREIGEILGKASFCND